jgi:2-isopropylmalate synthase
MKERLHLFDTTLRDGAQTNGVDFTLHDKTPSPACSIGSASTMSRASYPGANPTDTELFSKDCKLRRRSRLSA